jgi:hypothetical protein
VGRVSEFFRPVKLHGFNLHKWDYLGFSKPELRDYEGNVTCMTHVHFFVNRADRTRRDFFVQSTDSVKFLRDHMWADKARLWKALEITEHSVVEYWPSQYLRSAKRREGLVWDDEDLVWYEVEPETHTEDNVITVEFNR